MLTRIISGAVGVAIMIVVFIFHDTILLPIMVAAMTAVMLFELLRAVKLEKNLPILISSEICGMAMPFIYHEYETTNCGDIFDGGCIDCMTTVVNADFSKLRMYPFILILAAAFVIFVTWLKKHKEIRYEQVFFVLAVMVFVPNAMSTMVRIDRMGGVFMLILALCGAWIADTGAYFTGVAFGKHKLCPEISPKKTIEGFIGGIVTTGVVYAAAVAVYNKNADPVSLIITFLFGAVCAVIGTVGDLSASMVKRQIGFKDYGKIMPGHGGLMDRFDSVLFVLPTFYALLSLGDLIDLGLI
ncbi:MAG: phosphatidate cytidylyltransferase [Oscillospiraceae bacterium]|nr:phosphatidate cytidylyltransferase [Oscillospiraceae bacterium]